MAVATASQSPGAGPRLQANDPRTDSHSLLDRITATAASVAPTIRERLRFYEDNPDMAPNMIGTAITFGLALMVAVVMIIVTGLFIANAPTSGAFQGTLDLAEDIGGAGFAILIVTLLAIPVVGLVAYFYRSGLGGFVGGGTGNLR